MVKIGKIVVGKIKNPTLKAHRTTFIIGVMILLTLFSLSFVSAGVWDNINLYYDFNSTREVVSGSSNLTINEGAPTNTTTNCLIGICGGVSVGNNWRINADASFDLEGTKNKTLNFWARAAGAGGNNVYFIVGKTGTLDSWRLSHESSDRLRLINIIAGNPYSAASSFPQTNWNMVTIISNDTHIAWYINGTLVGSDVQGTSAGAGNFWIGNLNSGSDWIGLIDEMGVWNRTLSQFEITDLYNNGDGLSYQAGEGGVPVTTLNSPADNYTIANSTQVFNITSTIVGTGNILNNVTFFMWNSSSDEINLTSVNISGTSNITSFTVYGLSVSNYTWNAETCGTNSTGTSCVWGVGNRTLIVNSTLFSGPTFSTTISELSLETFSTNLTFYDTTATINKAYLIYNNTKSEITSISSLDSNTIRLTNSVTIPSITVETNFTFYWSVIFDSGLVANSSIESQVASTVLLDDCSVYPHLVFNFTMVDEDTQEFMVGTDYNTSIKIDLTLASIQDPTSSTNFSMDYDKTNGALVCMNDTFGTSSFRVDALIEYGADEHFVEFYNIQNFTLGSSTTSNNLTLYNLNDSVGQEFKITYKDANFDIVPGALIQIQRQYIDEGTFKTVEIPRISGAGYTIAHLIRNDIVYNLIILKDAQILASFNNIVANCQTPALQECEINLNSFGTSVEIDNFHDSGDFIYTLDFNRDLRRVSSTFTIPSGVSTLNTLNVTLFDALGNTTVCSDSLNAAGGSLSCIVPQSFGNSTIIAKLYSGGVEKARGVISIGFNPRDLYGANLVFLGMMILVTIIGISISDSPASSIFILVIGLVLLVALNIIRPTGWIGPTATILWFVIAMVIVMVKGGNRN